MWFAAKKEDREYWAMQRSERGRKRRPDRTGVEHLPVSIFTDGAINACMRGWSCVREASGASPRSNSVFVEQIVRMKGMCTVQ